LLGVCKSVKIEGKGQKHTPNPRFRTESKDDIILGIKKNIIVL
jgi:hypothetical protein